MISTAEWLSNAILYVNISISEFSSEIFWLKKRKHVLTTSKYYLEASFWLILLLEFQFSTLSEEFDGADCLNRLKSDKIFRNFF